MCLNCKTLYIFAILCYARFGENERELSWYKCFSTEKGIDIDIDRYSRYGKYATHNYMGITNNKPGCFSILAKWFHI